MPSTIDSSIRVRMWHIAKCAGMLGTFKFPPHLSYRFVCATATSYLKSYRSSSGQVPDKFRTSSGQVPDKKPALPRHGIRPIKVTQESLRKIRFHRGLGGSEKGSK